MAAGQKITRDITKRDGDSARDSTSGAEDPFDGGFDLREVDEEYYSTGT